MLWFPAAALPARIWTAPPSERLTLIAQHRRAWQWINVSLAAATVALVLGVAALAGPLEQEGGGALAPLGLAALLLGAALWLASLVFRVTATVEAAAAGSTPGFELVSSWAGGLFLAWSVLGNAALLGLGAAIVRSGYPAAWAGWATIVLSAVILVQLLVTGDALPGTYHLGPAVVGIALLLD